MMTLADKIVQNIKDDHIKPTPKWYFTWGNGLKGLLFVLFITLGSLAFSVVLFAISQSDFKLLSHFGHTMLEKILVVMPILWLVLLVVFLSGSILSVLQASRAYKFTFDKWVAFSTGLSIVLGTLFFITGGAQMFEQKFATSIESYESIQEKKSKIWSQPQLGMLSGKIIESGDKRLTITDWRNENWNIIIDSAFVAPQLTLEAGELIKINGNIVDGHTFEAERITPWGGMPGKCSNEKK